MLGTNTAAYPVLNKEIPQPSRAHFRKRISETFEPTGIKSSFSSSNLHETGGES